MHNCVLVKIDGKNVLNYVRWLINNRINIKKIEIVTHNTLYITIDYKYYNFLKKYSKTYKITIIKKYGNLQLFDFLKNNYIIIVSFILASIFLYFISGYIFSIDIIYNDELISNIVEKELAKYSIKPYKRKKSYAYLNDVKDKILKDNQDILEWLEIEESGTKYIVRLVERKKESQNVDYLYQSIIAKKDATLVDIRAYNGEKIKLVNDYVKKSDVVISGILSKPNGEIIYTKALGKIFGETWYKADIEYPMYYQEESLTGKSKKVISLYFLNKEIPIFPYKKYKNFSKKQTILFESNILPIKIVKEKLYEVIVKEGIYTPDEAIRIAIDTTIRKMKSNNSNIIELRHYKILSKQITNSKVKFSLFIATTEDITSIREDIPQIVVEN